MTDKEAILNLKDGESYAVPESDYGKAEIWLKYDRYFLFEIPMYGGRAIFSGTFACSAVDELIKTYESWT